MFCAAGREEPGAVVTVDSTNEIHLWQVARYERPREFYVAKHLHPNDLDASLKETPQLELLFLPFFLSSL